MLPMAAGVETMEVESEPALKPTPELGAAAKFAGLQTKAVKVHFDAEKRLVCAEYPGVVRDPLKMLETLGGEEGVSRIYADPSRRLELHFRPKDPYCHPVCGNRFPSTSMLLRVKRKKKKIRAEAPPKEGECEEEIKYEMEILGVIGTTYKFQGMSDFQFLALHNASAGSQMSMYDKVILRKPEHKEFFDQELPLYIPPPIFSRVDNPVDYFYRPEVQHREGYQPPKLSNENLIGLGRARRPHNAIFVNFDDAEVPSQPLEAAVQNWSKFNTQAADRKVEEELKGIFAIRPIWSRNAVKSNINVHPEKLKLLLPFVAYYMLTGPWRSLWVRFGYDPRKDSKAKIYQVLDFRLRCSTKHGYMASDMPVKAKRSTFNYSLPITISKPVPQVVRIQDLTKAPKILSFPHRRMLTLSGYKLKESVYIFREDTLPPYRQMFYQLCDLDVDSLKKIIHRNNGNETTCDERDGWCLPKTSDDLRDRMSNMIKEVCRKNRAASTCLRKKPSVTQEREEHESAEEEEEDEEEEYAPSEGSENEMETEILDYI
ncbi:general transcription factor 3C polypeptide 5 [Leucoraja erinacea]|uniref:general transcription factor 3C polypeptide 5 n=1 Tax=Leucoraja erinaceus TaxID=7782 RepID=UPI00245867EC|nr:general transcription factor 3C polypeptide 5 [Leucoraja erinacea]